ncbi:MAG: serine hydrolase [Spartobacteria bacterium]|nr:serine hydrolase [Spartobacteria bacterium]
MKLICKRAGAVFFFFSLVTCRPAQSANESVARTIASGAQKEDEVGKTIQTYLDSLAAENKLSGVILIAKDGSAIASKASGVANKEKNAPVSLDTKFNIGSMNKMFTGIAITQLAQEGKLDFTDPINKHLREYPNKEVGAKVTIHQLLTHTSGMGTYTNDRFRSERTKLTTIAAHFPLFVNDPLAFAPGEKFAYSNSGYMVLGAIVERVSGQDYYTYIRDHIFRPAGMINSGFYEPGKAIPNLAVGYTKMDAEGKESEQLHDNTDLIEIRGGPAGGGYSTAPDLVKFHHALRSDKLLNREYTDLATKGKVEAPGPIGHYAYGFGDKVFDGKHIVGHNGGWPGVAANFEMYPELGYTSVILMNSDPPTMMPAIMQLRKLIPAQ